MKYMRLSGGWGRGWVWRTRGFSGQDKGVGEAWLGGGSYELWRELGGWWVREEEAGR